MIAVITTVGIVVIHNDRHHEGIVMQLNLGCNSKPTVMFLYKVKKDTEV